MKRLLFILLISTVYANYSFSQSLNGYKYIYVPTLKYENDRTDIWNISQKLKTWFTEKGLIVISENSIKPEELKKDPCLMLECEIEHTEITYGTNKVTINLINCQKQSIYNKTGSAMGWSLQDDYNKATKRAYEDIKEIKYKFDSSKILSKEIEKSFPTLELTGFTEEFIKKYLSENKTDAIEGIYKSYQSDGLPYYKIGIIKSKDTYKAVIIETDRPYWKTGEIKAIFEPSSMRGLYSVKWYSSNKTPYETFASLENLALLNVELKDTKTGIKRQDKFIKMFPITSSEFANKNDNSKGSGSGFFITTNGIIATNAHVIEGSTNIEVIVANEVGSFTYKSKVVLIDNKNDVALLQIDDEKFKGLTSIPFGFNESAEVGSKVFTIGYPLNDVMGTNFKVTDGIISSKSGIADDIRYYQISVPLQPGNSGGPLFNKEGNVIGITSARLNSKAIGTQVENVNYAIKCSYLLKLFNMLPNSNKVPSSSQIASKELQEQVKVLKNYVCLIKVY